MQKTDKIYDLVIVGGGPAGVSAAIYAKRAGMDVIVLANKIGGMVNDAYLIGNYAGMGEISGADLARKFGEQLESLKIETRAVVVDGINRQGDFFEIKTEDREIFRGRAVILATGMRRKKLGVPGEEEFLHRGVGYCALCDGPLFKNKNVAVIGGGNAGISAAIYLAGIAEKIYVIEALKNLPGEDFWQGQLAREKKVTVLLDSMPVEILGGKRVTGIKLRGSEEILAVDGVFVEIGGQPETGLAKQLGLKMDAKGYIEVGVDGATSVPGVWAAGDNTTGSGGVRQIITAAAEGAVAGGAVAKFLRIKNK